MASDNLTLQETFLDPREVVVPVLGLNPSGAVQQFLGTGSLIGDGSILLAAYFQRRGGAAGYFGDNEIPVVDMAALTHLVAEDLDRGVRRERLLFAVVMLSEWWIAYRKHWGEMKEMASVLPN
ncbi:MAG: hypothetical protein KAH24_09485 [Holophagae bacterium]|nr:hypothetical protein [Holophagae bacterium]